MPVNPCSEQASDINLVADNSGFNFQYASEELRMRLLLLSVFVVPDVVEQRPVVVIHHLPVLDYGIFRRLEHKHLLPLVFSVV